MGEKTSKKTAPAAKSTKKAATSKKGAPPPKEAIKRIIPETTGVNALHAIKATRRKGNLTAAFLRFMGPLVEGVTRLALLNMGSAKTAKLIHFQNSVSASGGAHSLGRLRIEAAKKAPRTKKVAAPAAEEAAAAPAAEVFVDASAEVAAEVVDPGAAPVEVTANE